MIKNLQFAAVLLVIISTHALASTISFSTFVTASSISSLLGQDNTIGFTYAGNKFVGSVYFGANNDQLYQTDLSGGNVQKFGSPLPASAGGEVVLAASLGQGGFATGDIYTGSQNNGNIYHYSNSGGAPTLFATVPTGDIRGILFDPGSSFGGKMLVTTDTGSIYTVASNGTVTPLASVGEDTEGMDIATSAWGTFAGDVLVDSEGSGDLRLISPTGTVTLLPVNVPIAETVSFVPLNLGSSGNPLEGFYVANYPVDVQFASAAVFAGLQGDAIVTSEDSSSARIWDLHYNGTTFTVTQFTGHLPSQSEDGIFVTAQRIIDVTTPEPSSAMLVGGALLALGSLISRRKQPA